MTKERITVKELKKFLEDKDDNSYVVVDMYDSEAHHKEFLRVEQFTDKGQLDSKELLIVSCKN